MVTLVQANPRRLHGEAPLTDLVSVQVKERLISCAVISISIKTDNYVLFLLDVSINLSIGIIGEDNVEVPDLPVKALLEHALTHCTRRNGIDFEFLTVAMPLLVGVEYFRCASKIVDFPQTDDAAAGFRSRRYRCQ